MPDAATQAQPDEDAALGAVENDPSATSASPNQTSMAGQLGHRDEDEMLKSADTDFPEPDATEEHSGERSA